MPGWTKIYIGKIKRDDLLNVVREVKERWRYTENIWPNGDRKLVPQIKASRDSYGQYWIWLNAAALTRLLLSCKDIPEPPSLRREEEPIKLEDIPF